MQASDHLHLIDGSGFIFRAFHALPPLQRKSDGVHVGAVSGFCNMLWRLVRDAQRDQSSNRPTHMAVIFDHQSPTFRKMIYPAYKAHRERPAIELTSQFGMIREAVAAFSVASTELPGYEADDLIATYARQASAAGARTTIVSSDKDLMQLVSDKVEQFDPMSQKTYGIAEVVAKWGVAPGKMIDLQALTGDTSDNIPGCPGIGPKTAAKMLEQLGSLDRILENTERIEARAVRQSVTANKGSILMSRELVALDCHVPAPVGIDDLCVQSTDMPRLLGFLDSMEFTALRQDIEKYGL